MPEAEPIYLPGAEHAYIPNEKLRDYALNPHHARGGAKARVFGSALGLEQADWVWLRDQILAKVGNIPVSGHRIDAHGVRYTVVVPILGRNGRLRDVVTGWIIEPDKPPRLTTAYVSRRRNP